MSTNGHESERHDSHPCPFVLIRGSLFLNRMTDTRSKEPLEVCPHCGSRDLFVRKDFPQKLGLAIVIVAGVAFLALAARPTTFRWGVWVLVAAVIVDAILYFFVPRVTTCYRCRADFRDVPVNPKHGAFELAVGEKYRSR